MNNILANILVGGKRTELLPLVEQRCKAAVPVFGKYRIIDFTLSNLINSQIRKINVMVQYMYDSLQKHIRDGWNFLPHILGEYIDVYPPQQREGERWYQGTADAIYQNLFSIESANPEHILIVHGDHITTVDYRKIINHHIDTNADLTMATIYIEPEWSGKFGNIKVKEENGPLIEFFEKPGEPAGKTDEDGNIMINAGVYVFKTDALIKELKKDNTNDKSEHNISKNIIPQMLKDKKKIMTYHYQTQEERLYNWHFFLNLDHYYQTNMNMLKHQWKIDLDSEEWPIRTVQYQNPPTFVNNDVQGDINNCSIGSGGEIKGTVKDSIIGNNVVIEKGAIVENSILFNGVIVKKGAKVKNSILDKYVLVEDNHTLGYNFESDKNTFHTTEKGIVVIGKGRII